MKKNCLVSVFIEGTKGRLISKTEVIRQDDKRLQLVVKVTTP